MQKVLVAGATGYLGRYVVKELIGRDYRTTALVRNSSKFLEFDTPVNKVIQAEVTNPSRLIDCCDTIDVVFSSIGITRQSDGLSYMDVDYQANINLLNEAQRSGVKKFIYVSLLNGEKLRSLRICDAKERFVEALRESGLDYCVIRPNGFFSDMTEFYTMAQKGRIYLFGDGSQRSNPIHGADLAKVCIDAIHGQELEIEVGGPQTLSHSEIAQVAFEAADKPVKVTYVPDWTRRLVLRTAKLLLSGNKYGPVEFFMNVMAIDMTAPEYGEHTLKAYYRSLANETQLA